MRQTARSLFGPIQGIARPGTKTGSKRRAIVRTFTARNRAENPWPNISAEATPHGQPFDLSDEFPLPQSWLWHACGEVAIDLVVRARLGCVRIGRDRLLVAHNALYSHGFHQTFHCAAGNVVIIPPQLVPDFARTISLAAIIKGVFDLLSIYCVLFGSV